MGRKRYTHLRRPTQKLVRAPLLKHYKIPTSLIELACLGTAMAVGVVLSPIFYSPFNTPSAPNNLSPSQTLQENFAGTKTGHASRLSLQTQAELKAWKILVMPPADLSALLNNEAQLKDTLAVLVHGSNNQAVKNAAARLYANYEMTHHFDTFNKKLYDTLITRLSEDKNLLQRINKLPELNEPAQLEVLQDITDIFFRVCQTPAPKVVYFSEPPNMAHNTTLYGQADYTNYKIKINTHPDIRAKIEAQGMVMMLKTLMHECNHILHDTLYNSPSEIPRIFDALGARPAKGYDEIYNFYYLMGLNNQIYHAIDTSLPTDYAAYKNAPVEIYADIPAQSLAKGIIEIARQAEVRPPSLSQQTIKLLFDAPPQH